MQDFLRYVPVYTQIVSFVDRFHESEKAFAKAQQEFVSWILKELPYKQSLWTKRLLMGSKI